MHLVKGSQLCKWSNRTYVYYRKFKSFKLTKANENTIRCMMLCFMLSCAISIFALLAGIEKKQILSVGFWLSHESFPKNEPLAKDWWGLKNGKCEFYFLYLWLWNVFLDTWKKSSKWWFSSTGEACRVYIFYLFSSHILKIYFESIFSYKILINVHDIYLYDLILYHIYSMMINRSNSGALHFKWNKTVH